MERLVKDHLRLSLLPSPSKALNRKVDTFNQAIVFEYSTVVEKDNRVLVINIKSKTLYPMKRFSILAITLCAICGSAFGQQSDRLKREYPFRDTWQRKATGGLNRLLHVL